MRHWTDETGREADALYPTFTDAKIRSYQDLARQQIAAAFAACNDDALADLQAMHDALSREMLERAGRKSTGPRVRVKRGEQ
jgi:hypothetical protein